jgi:YHS domain-containing protein
MTLPELTRRGLIAALAAAALGSHVAAQEKAAVEASAAVGPIYTGILSRTAVGGYDPVSYFSGNPQKGSSKITHSWSGATWRFASEENRDKFKADPAAFAPRYGGHCAYAAARGYKAKGDPQHWKIVEGRLYLNLSADVQKEWEKDIPGEIQRADANWPSKVR